jgi:membrane peptidoglycan carboxypeptidase
MLLPHHSANVRKKWLHRFFFFVLFCLLGIGVYGIVWFNNNILYNLPTINPDNLQTMFLFSQSSIITDRNGKKLYKLFDENRAYISFDEFSPYLVNAAIATEDKTFWENDGLDYFGIIRAVIDNIGLKL